MTTRKQKLASNYALRCKSAARTRARNCSGVSGGTSVGDTWAGFGFTTASAFLRNNPSTKAPPAAHIQAVLTVIGRRVVGPEVLNLVNVPLCSKRTWKAPT
jgi:hypothetical protein